MLYINLYSPTEKRQYGTEIELLKTQGRVLNSSTFHTATFIPKYAAYCGRREGSRGLCRQLL